MQQLATRLRRILVQEDGLALEFVVLLLVVLAMLSVLLTTVVLSSQQTSANSASQADARAAAEAGIDNYISTLLLDNQYYLQYLAPGEATRQSTATGDQLASVQPPSSPTAWASSEGTQWSYPNGKDAWVDLGNGYSYDLEVTPPQTGSNGTNYLQIVSTGAKNGSSASTDKQAIQVLVRPASVADFQMLSAATVSYGTNAVTQGKIYSSQNVDFCGNAYADIYAEGEVYTSASQAGCGGNGVVHSPAGTYDSDSNPGIRTKISTPVNFASFQVSLDDISRAAANAGGISLANVTGKVAWEITFDSSGNVLYRSCTGSQPIETTQPTCSGSWTTKPIPTNGAIYSALPVLIAGGTSTCTDPQVGTLTNATCVGGRVTVASAGNIVIGDDIGYVASGTDVLGLMAQNNVLVASWVGNSLTWRAAALAENGCWSEPQPGCDGQSTPSDGSHSGTMTFTGASATYSGGAMSMFANRSYNYDTTLAYLQPPWFPTLPQAYTILLYRNLPNGS
jgi:type II secretory pathway pseudopilin PulG